MLHSEGAWIIPKVLRYSGYVDLIFYLQKLRLCTLVGLKSMSLLQLADHANSEELHFELEFRIYRYLLGSLFPYHSTFFLGYFEGYGLW